VIGDALQHRRHFRDRNNKTQITRGRLAQCDDIDALAIDLNLETIDLIVVVEYLARNVAVAFAKRIHCAFECLFRLAPQQENAVT
jgi:hypothetical protein